MRRFFLSSIIFAGCLSTISSLSAWAEPFSSQGLREVTSDFSVEETADRLEEVLEERGLTVFNRIDHAANAAEVGQDLRPTELIIFGNPRAGTALMQCNQIAGIDLPLKALIWQDETDQVRLAYNDPTYLMERHHLDSCAGVIEQISGALVGLATAATEGI